MLIAETRGKSLSSVQNREDYLTSGVFGHLQYMPPNIFWPSLLTRAAAYNGQHNLRSYLQHEELDVAKYESLDIDFWPRKAKIGEPDMIMQFRGKGMRTLRIVVEVKLWSRKSGRGKQDQLARYFKLLKQGDRNMITLFVYLTPEKARCQADLDDTFAQNPRLKDLQDRVFHLCWYDLAEIAEKEARQQSRPYDMILEDVARFLQRRELGKYVGLAPTDTRTSLKLEEASTGSFVISIFPW